MNILMSGDENMYDGFELVIYSTMKHNKNVNWYIFTMNINCHIVGEPKEFREVNEFQRHRLAKIVHYFDPNSTISFINVQQLYDETISMNPNRESGFTPFTNLRLLADLALPDVDNVLYLDTDIVVQQDLSQMYKRYFTQDFNYAAYSLPEACFYTGEMVAGVLLMNLKKMRETHFMDKARWNLMNHEYRFPDQMALRDTEDPYPLAETYNFLFDLWKSDYQPAIIHFTNEMSRKVYSNSERDRFYRDYPQFQYVLDGMKIIDTINMEAPYEYIVWGR